MGQKYVQVALADIKAGDVVHLGTIGGRVRSIWRFAEPYDSFSVSFKKGTRWVGAMPCMFDPNYSNREAPKEYVSPMSRYPRRTRQERNQAVNDYFAEMEKEMAG